MHTVRCPFRHCTPGCSGYEDLQPRSALSLVAWLFTHTILVCNSVMALHGISGCNVVMCRVCASRVGSGAVYSNSSCCVAGFNGVMQCYANTRQCCAIIAQTWYCRFVCYVAAHYGSCQRDHGPCKSTAASYPTTTMTVLPLTMITGLLHLRLSLSPYGR